MVHQKICGRLKEEKSEKNNRVVSNRMEATQASEDWKAWILRKSVFQNHDDTKGGY